MRELRQYEWRRFGLKPSIDPVRPTHIVRIFGAPAGYEQGGKPIPYSNTFAVVETCNERDFQARFGAVKMPDPRDPNRYDPSMLEVKPRPILDVVFQGKGYRTQAERFKRELETMLDLWGVMVSRGGFYYFSDWFTYGTLYAIVSAVARDRRVRLYKRQKPTQISNPVKRVKRVF